jgi:hypothetical protein
LSELTEWHPAAEIPGNRELLAWLESEADPPAPKGMEFYGYELHVHPDLFDFRVLEGLMPGPVVYVAAFGLPALAHPNGLIFVFAYGMGDLYFRAVEIDSPLTIGALGPA